MPFTYPKQPHIRKHGPSGYEDYRSYKEWLRDEFCFRCVYCLERETWYPNGKDSFSVDHVKPKGRPEYKHLVNDYDNLVYGCSRCNSAKGRIELLDPCQAAFDCHLQVDEEGNIKGLTHEGELLIDLLGLARDRMRLIRKKYLRILALYHKYSHVQEVAELYKQTFGFPLDLPDLNALRPKNNSKPEGISGSFSRLRMTRRLPDTYF